MELATIITAIIITLPIMLLTLAQVAERWHSWRILAWLILGIVQLLWGISILSALLTATIGSHFTLNPPSNMKAILSLDWRFVTIDLLVTFLTSSLIFLPVVRRAIAKILPLEQDNTVHTTALLYAIWLLGLMAIQYQFLRHITNMKNLSINGWMLWGQALYFAIIGIVGVGIWVRRSPKETWQRLGFGRLQSTDWLIIFGSVLLMLGLQAFWSIAYSLFSPGSFQNMEALNDQLLGQLLNPWGALSIGLSAGIGEEMLFRGAIQPRFGLLLTSIIFGLIHTQYNLIILPLIFLFGLILGWIRQHRNLTVSIFTHAVYDSSLVLLAIAAQRLTT